MLKQLKLIWQPWKSVVCQQATYAIHPLTGETVPIWVANFVLMSYGSGAVMSVPAHDERDWDFAKSYGLPIKQVIAPANGDDFDVQEAAYTEKGILVNSGDFDGLTSEDAFDAIAELLKSKTKGRKTINYRLRDWGVSRQRYWGCPIPIIYCDDCGAVPVPEDQLPVELPLKWSLMSLASRQSSKCQSFTKQNVLNVAVMRRVRPIPLTHSLSHLGTTHVSQDLITTSLC